MAAKGRPTKYSEAICAEICSQLAEGRSLRTVCEAENMPDKATVFRWLGALKPDGKYKHESFRDQYAHAKQEAADAMAEEILEIADGASTVILGIDRSDGARVNAEKMKIDVRKWLMSKMKPKKYGDRLDVTSDGKRLETTPVIISQIKPRNQSKSNTKK